MVLGVRVSDEDEEDEFIEIEVWPDAMLSVSVFRRTKAEMHIGGMGGVIFGGLSSTEVQAACYLSQVPLDLLTDVTDDVMFMAAIAANLNNAAQGSKR